MSASIFNNYHYLFILSKTNKLNVFLDLATNNNIDITIYFQENKITKQFICNIGNEHPKILYENEEKVIFVLTQDSFNKLLKMVSVDNYIKLIGELEDESIIENICLENILDIEFKDSKNIITSCIDRIKLEGVGELYFFDKEPITIIFHLNNNSDKSVSILPIKTALIENGFSTDYYITERCIPAPNDMERNYLINNTDGLNKEDCFKQLYHNKLSKKYFYNSTINIVSDASATIASLLNKTKTEIKVEFKVEFKVEKYRQSKTKEGRDYKLFIYLFMICRI